MSEAIEDIRILSAKEVGALLGLHRETIYRWARLGIIPGFHLNNGLWRFSIADVRAYIKAQASKSRGDSTAATEDSKGKVIRYNSHTKRYEHAAE